MTVSYLQNMKDIIDDLNAAIAGGGGGGGGPTSWGSITGTLSDQTDLQTILDGKAADSHTHIISDVTGLQTALDGKQDAGAYGILKTATVTVGGTNEHNELVTDADVNSSSTIILSLAGVSDSDENDPELLDVVGMSAKAGTGNFTVTMSFLQKTSGPIKLNYILG